MVVVERVVVAAEVAVAVVVVTLIRMKKSLHLNSYKYNRNVSTLMSKRISAVDL